MANTAMTTAFFSTLLFLFLFQTPPVGQDLFLPFVQHPSSFSNPHPAAAARDQSPNTWLAWDFSARFGARGPVAFSLYLEPTNNALITPQAIQVADHFWVPTTLALGVEYHWKVVAEDANGRVFESPTWHFQVEVMTDNPDLNAMVEIPAGRYWMGCDAASERWHPCLEKEFPLRNIYLDAFAIDKYEVTNREYLACVNAGGCSLPLQSNSNKRDDYLWNAAYADYPVLYVSRWDAGEFCAWEEKRLPTEAEWEKAARGPVDTREWPWGNAYPNCTLANFADDRNPADSSRCLDDTDRVGLRPLGASPYGVMDMAGNAFEWVNDLYNIEYYHEAPDVNPSGPAEAHTEVSDGPTEIPYFSIRGGSYRARWYYPRVTHRHWGHKGPDGTSTDDLPLFRNNYVGFRCARSLP